MILQERDLIQCVKGKKVFHARVLNMNDEAGTVNVTEVVKQKIYTVDKNDIIANYGESPDLDFLKINEYKRTVIIEGLGSCEIYRNLNETETKELMKLSTVISDLKDYTWLLPFANIKVCVNKSKNNQSSFKFNKKEGKYEIVLSPWNMTFEVLRDLLFSLIGKIVYDHCQVKSVKANWILLFEHNIHQENYEAKKVMNLRESFLNSGMTVKDYVNQMDDGNLMYKVYSYIREKYKFTAKDIDLLVSIGNDLYKYWPQVGFSISDFSDFVNDQAKKSAIDFFAETFSYYLAKKPIAEKLTFAMTTSLTFLRDKTVNFGEGVLEKQKSVSVSAEVIHTKPTGQELAMA